MEVTHYVLVVDSWAKGAFFVVDIKVFKGVLHKNFAVVLNKRYRQEKGLKSKMV